MQKHEIKQFVNILKNDGDKILDASSKLSLSTSLLSKLNESFAHFVPVHDVLVTPFHVLNTSTALLDNFIDLQFLYDFVQKTLALKIFPDYKLLNDDRIDLRLFRNLRLLEVHRLSLNVVKGLKSLRSQLEYMTCMRSVNTLRDVLENCGGDRSQGYVWCELKEAVFSHNNLNNVDGSLEFTPRLQSLDLSYNLIKNIESLNLLSNLRYLNLANNCIESLPPFSGQICFNLQVLVLRNNYLENIAEVQTLYNLIELDLSNNCLFNFDYLLPLTLLSKLSILGLNGNPLCYHNNYRIKVSGYLHCDDVKRFKLDDKFLSKKELRNAGTVQPPSSISSFNRSESFNSTTTASTIINLQRQINQSGDDMESFNNSIQTVILAKDANQTSDMEVSCTSSFEQALEHERREIFRNVKHGMQDSGFVAGPRPASPSSDSIGSATSLHSNERLDDALQYSESDIEILSNPSQSSIEVLSSGQTPRFVMSSLVMPTALKDFCMDSDLKKICDQVQRSL